MGGSPGISNFDHYQFLQDLSDVGGVQTVNPLSHWNRAMAAEDSNIELEVGRQFMILTKISNTGAMTIREDIAFNLRINGGTWTADLQGPTTTDTGPVQAYGKANGICTFVDYVGDGISTNERLTAVGGTTYDGAESVCWSDGGGNASGQRALDAGNSFNFGFNFRLNPGYAFNQGDEIEFRLTIANAVLDNYNVSNPIVTVMLPTATYGQRSYRDPIRLRM